MENAPHFGFDAPPFPMSARAKITTKTGETPVAAAHGLPQALLMNGAPLRPNPPDRPLNVLVIADSLVPVPPQDYGGTERIVYHLCSELERIGHRVDLMAGPGSRRFSGRLFIHRRPSLQKLSRLFRKLWFQLISLYACRDADVVINFGRLDYLASILRTRKPLICRFGNPISQSEIDWVIKRRKKQIRFIGVSRSQVSGLEFVPKADIIPNAVDLNRIQCSTPPNREPYLVFLGRITANKGADAAIRVCRQSGLKLKMAGNIPEEPGAIEFFEKEIRPHLGNGVEWLGAIDDEAKVALLSSATALLFPIRWPEPFGIVMIESLACGTPVIATRCASTPEVIEDGVNGFICESEEEMIAALSRLPTIDRLACRSSAEKRFSVSVMTRAYLSVFHELLELRE